MPVFASLSSRLITSLSLPFMSGNSENSRSCVSDCANWPCWCPFKSRKYALLLCCILKNTRVSRVSHNFWHFTFMQRGWGREALRHLQDVHGIRLRWALQPALVAKRAGSALPTHVPDPTQPEAECNAGLARSQPAAQLRHTKHANPQRPFCLTSPHQHGRLTHVDHPARLG